MYFESVRVGCDTKHVGSSYLVRGFLVNYILIVLDKFISTTELKSCVTVYSLGRILVNCSERTRGKFL